MELSEHLEQIRRDTAALTAGMNTGIANDIWTPAAELALSLAAAVETIIATLDHR